MNISDLAKRICLFAMLAFSAAATMAQQLSISPSAPRGRETVLLHVTSAVPFELGRESVALRDGKLIVTLRAYVNAPGTGPSAPGTAAAVTSGDVVLGRLPQGNYTADVYMTSRESVASLLGSTSFVVSDETIGRQTASAFDYSDLWWTPTESGWGISIFTRGDNLFAVWFVYDRAGNPSWYSLQGGTWLSPTQYTGRIFKTSANAMAGVDVLTKTTASEVGTGTITFNTYDQAVFSFTLNGIAGSKTISRQPI